MEVGIIAVLLMAIGIVAGMFIERSRKVHKETQGILIVDCSDPADGPYLFLELDVPVADVVSRKQASFTVNVRQ